MFDAVQAQEDLTGALLAYTPLATVPVASLRKLRLQQEVTVRSLLETGRAGKYGAAVVVEQPTAETRNPNVSGPVLDWVFPVVVLEQADINMSSVGSQLSAEELGQLVLDCLHLHSDERTGVFQASGGLRPETDLAWDGVIAYRAEFTIIGRSVQTARVLPVTVTFATGNVTLACATAGASIRYTLDGTFPGISATTYTAPFAAAAGKVVRAAAYKSGSNMSQVVCRTASY